MSSPRSTIYFSLNVVKLLEQAYTAGTVYIFKLLIFMKFGKYFTVHLGDLKISRILAETVGKCVP